MVIQRTTTMNSSTTNRSANRNLAPKDMLKRKQLEEELIDFMKSKQTEYPFMTKKRWVESFNTGLDLIHESQPKPKNERTLSTDDNHINTWNSLKLLENEAPKVRERLHGRIQAIVRNNNASAEIGRSDKCVLISNSINGVQWLKDERTILNKNQQAHTETFQVTVAVLILAGIKPRSGDVCSHLCHVRQCVNESHLVFESHSRNISRNQCGKVGLCKCQQEPRCFTQRSTVTNDHAAKEHTETDDFASSE